MGFALEEEGATAPGWPHVVCAGSGWAWHDDPRRQRCFVATVSAPAEIVANAIGGRLGAAPVDRLLAIGALNGQSARVVERTFRIFQKQCASCAENHLEIVLQTLRALPHIHPDAVSALRAAMVPERRLLSPLIHDRELPKLPNDPMEVEELLADARLRKKVKRLIRTANNLPVWPGDHERTRVAQIAFARQYALRNRIGVPSILPLRGPLTP